MNADYRYILASNKVPKLNCPYCGAKKHWQRYVDTETGEILPEQHGRCDNVSKCGCFVMPPMETLCYFVQINSIEAISEKAVLIKQDEVEQILPKSTILEQTETGLYVAEYFLSNKGNEPEKPLLISFDSDDRKYFQDNNTSFKPQQKKAIPPPQPDPVFFDFETFKKALQHYEQNTFIQNLLQRVKFPFDVEDVTKVIQLYRLGTVARGYRAGAITFPFIDLNNNVRTIQVKQFDEQNHTTGTDFLHSIIEKHHNRSNKPLPEWLGAYIEYEPKVSCLFGEHLLNKHPNNPIFLFEAPKTAVYATLYFGFPDTPKSPICLAVYNKSSFSFDKVKVLQGRFVYVFPDLSKDGGTFNEWATKAKDYESRLPRTHFILSDLLEQYGTPEQKAKGADIADVVIKHDWRKFRLQNKPVEPPQIESGTLTPPAQKQTVHNPPPAKIELPQTKPVEVIERFLYVEKIARSAFGNTQTKSVEEAVYANQKRLKETEILNEVGKFDKCGNSKLLFNEMIKLEIIEPTPNPFIFQLTGKTIF